MEHSDWLPKFLVIFAIIWLWIGSRRLFSVYNVKGGRDYVFALVMMYADPGIQLLEMFFPQHLTTTSSTS